MITTDSNGLNKAKFDDSKYTIAVDFDGTCVIHEFPKVGEDVPHATTILKKLAIEQGYNIILFTMRSNRYIDNGDGTFTIDDYLDQAIKWFEVRGIPLAGIQTNPNQHTWTSSPKAYANLYIDDAGICCPLIKPIEERPYVDWHKVEEHLKLTGIL